MQPEHHSSAGFMVQTLLHGLIVAIQSQGNGVG